MILSNTQQRHTWTRIDYVVEADDAVNTGALQPINSSVLMKFFYGARMARFDLLKAVANLAKTVAKLNANCETRLHRLICYVKSSLDLRLKGHIGYSFDKLALFFYSDADFAGDKDSSKSTTGIFMALTGPSIFFPLNGVSKKHMCVSHSTPEVSQLMQPFASKDCPQYNCGTSY